MAMKRIINQPTKGFTLVEFLLSSAIFSFFLVMVMVGFMQINRSYNRGATVKGVQQATRVVIEDISRTISASPVQVVTLRPSNTNASRPDGFRLCVDTVKYSWNGVFDDEYTTETYADTTEQYVLVKSSLGNSCAESPTKADSKVLISGTMNELGDGDLVVQSLLARGVSGFDGVYSLDLVLSSDDEALTAKGTNADCDFTTESVGGDAARQYCTVTSLSTVVSSRN